MTVGIFFFFNFFFSAKWTGFQSVVPNASDDSLPIPTASDPLSFDSMPPPPPDGTAATSIIVTKDRKDSSAKEVKAWTCIVCTNFNEKDLSICENPNCKVPRPFAEESPKPVADVAATSEKNLVNFH